MRPCGVRVYLLVCCRCLYFSTEFWVSEVGVRPPRSSVDDPLVGTWSLLLTEGDHILLIALLIAAWRLRFRSHEAR